MLNNAGRRVGARVREALDILERIGPARAVEVSSHMDGVEPNNAGKYCIRAVGLRLATVDRSGTWPVYAAAPGWRERIDARRPPPAPAPAPRHAGRPFALQAVWPAGNPSTTETRPHD